MSAVLARFTIPTNEGRPKSAAIGLPDLTAIDNCEGSYAFRSCLYGVRALIRHSSEDDLFGKDGALLEPLEPVRGQVERRRPVEQLLCHRLAHGR